jgi:hypothetical protein
MPSRLYELTVETALPHLEESLRYATTREQRCLARNELWSAFPILQHTALKGCKLDQQTRDEDAVSFLLDCGGSNGTTGHATWRIGPNQLSGTLYVKLGGKNMTFYQRVNARGLAECESAPTALRDIRGAVQ